MACSGHERTASATLASRSAGTSPSMMAVEWPSTSSSWKTSGAIMLQSVWPWHRSGSTCTFTSGFPSHWSERKRLTLQVEVVPLQVSAGVHPQLHAGDVAGLVGGEEQHRVADVHWLDPRDRHGLLDVERGGGVFLGRVLQVRPEGLVHRVALQHVRVDVGRVDDVGPDL